MSTIRLDVPRNPGRNELRYSHIPYLGQVYARRVQDTPFVLTGETELELVEVGKREEGRLTLLEMQHRFQETDKVAAGDIHRQALNDLVAKVRSEGGVQALHTLLPKDWRLKDRPLLFLGTQWGSLVTPLKPPKEERLCSFMIWDGDGYYHSTLWLGHDQPAHSALVTVRGIA